MLGVFAAVGRVGVYAAGLVPPLTTGPRFLEEFGRHFANTCVRGLIPVCVIVASFGAVVALQGLNIFRIFGTEGMLPSLVVVAVLREAAPTFCGIMMAAQAGSTMAAELAVMRVKEQLDATEVMSVDPIRYHVCPRLLALVCAAPILTILSAASGIIAAWIVTVQFAGVSHGTFHANMFSFLTQADLVAGFVKSISYGLLIGIISTYLGYPARRDARGVGQAANGAVVGSIICIVIVNYIITSAVFGAAS